MSINYVPGQIAVVSGQYPVIDPYGRNTGREVTVTRGEPFPPLPYRGGGFGKPDVTKHR